ncbi:bifunctional DNA primase/polymerase [Stackebrandtia soli]|uniref:bifunctional DNA primase/polymerase n=1 Tax=Stackebrandtia soli TaxID=1892856 RepID=UPI0039EBBAA9
MDDGSAVLAAALMVDAAYDHAARGWPVFVLGDGKTPLPNCTRCRTADGTHDMETCVCLTCHGFYAATTDADRLAAVICAHPTGVLAVRTGAASGTVVVDVDPRSGGAATLAELLAAGLLPPTLTARTGSGGVHLYYAHPGGTIRSGAGALGPGVDVKADKGYVVVPPSRIGERAYVWADGGPDSVPVTTMPVALLDRLTTLPPAPRLTPPAASNPFAAPVDASGRLAGIVAAVLAARPGERNTVLNWGAYTASEMVRTGAANVEGVTGALADAATRIGLTDREAHATIRSGLRAGGVA